MTWPINFIYDLYSELSFSFSGYFKYLFLLISISYLPSILCLKKLFFNSQGYIVAKMFKYGSVKYDKNLNNFRINLGYIKNPKLNLFSFLNKGCRASNLYNKNPYPLDTFCWKINYLSFGYTDKNIKELFINYKLRNLNLYSINMQNRLEIA